MKNKWLFIAGLSGLLCVAIGAFAAHGLSKVLEPKELAWIETGVRYQMFHTIAILAIGILNHWLQIKWLISLQGVGRTAFFFLAAVFMRSLLV
mgnify:CR=1 FL=1